MAKASVLVGGIWFCGPRKGVKRLLNGFTVQMVANAFSVDRSTVHDWLNAYARNGLDGLVDDARPGRPPFVPRAELEVMVGDTKRFTAYEFVEMV